MQVSSIILSLSANADEGLSVERSGSGPLCHMRQEERHIVRQSIEAKSKSTRATAAFDAAQHMMATDCIAELNRFCVDSRLFKSCHMLCTSCGAPRKTTELVNALLLYLLDKSPTRTT